MQAVDQRDMIPTGSESMLRCVLPLSPQLGWVVPPATRSEVLWQPRIQRLPGAPATWLGVVNVRGRVRPVIDPGRCWPLGLAHAVDPESGVLVLLDEGEHAVVLRIWGEPRIEVLQPAPAELVRPEFLPVGLAQVCGQLDTLLCIEIDHRAWLTELARMASIR